MTRVPLIAVFLILLGGGCNTVPPISLDGRDLVLVSWSAGGLPVSLVRGTMVRLSFADGSLSAHAGCNQIGGAYTISDGRLVTDSLWATEMGCDEPLQRQDERLTALLSSSPGLRFEDDRLVLDGPEGVATFRDRQAVEPSQPLAGPVWTLTTLIERDAATSVPGEIGSRIQFAEDGTFSVNPGCNAGRGRFELADGSLVFHEIALTKMACPGDRDRVERAVLEVLSGEPTYQIDGATLTLTSGDRGLQFSGS
jgi:heat shock protein HslJ